MHEELLDQYYTEVLINAKQGVRMGLGPRSLGFFDFTPQASTFWEAIQDQRLLVNYCPDCQKWLHPRRAGCPHCFNTDLIWQEVAGTGVLYTYSTIYHSPYPEWAEFTPYTVGIIQLSEGPFIFGLIKAAVEDIAINMKVKAAFPRRGSYRSLEFQPD